MAMQEIYRGRIVVGSYGEDDDALILAGDPEPLSEQVETDQELMVGGHDLLEELESFAGRFLHLEIQYFAADPTEEKP